MVALRGVIVDNVEHHLETRVVQSRDGGSKSVERVVLRVTRLRRKETQRVVAPIVRQLLFDQHAVIDESMDRQQLDGRDAEPLEVIDDRG